MVQEMSIMLKIDGLTPSRQSPILFDYLKNKMASYLSIDPEEFPADISFFDLGLTSLKAIEIKYNLEQELALQLRSTVLFDYPMLNKLNEFILQQKNPSLFTQVDKTQDEEANLAKNILNQYFDFDTNRE